MSVASSSNWLFSLVTSLSFLPLTENVSAFGNYKKGIFYILVHDLHLIEFSFDKLITIKQRHKLDS